MVRFVKSLVPFASLVASVSSAFAGSYQPGDFLIADLTGDRVGIFDAQLNFKSYLITGLDRATGLDVRPDGAVVVASQSTIGGAWGSVRVFSPSGAQVHRFDVPEFPFDVKFSPTGSLLQSTQQGSVPEFTVTGGYLGSFADARLNDAQSIAVVPGGKVWIGEGENDVIRVFDLATRKVLATVALDNGQQAATTMSFSAASNTVLVADATSGYVFERDAASGGFVRVFKPGTRVSPLGGVVRTAAGEVWATDNNTGDVLRWQADGTYLGLTSMRPTLTTLVNIVQVTNIPEPASAALAAAALICASRRTHRRR